MEVLKIVYGVEDVLVKEIKILMKFFHLWINIIFLRDLLSVIHYFKKNISKIKDVMIFVLYLKKWCSKWDYHSFWFVARVFKKKYPRFYFVSSTTKVLTKFEQLVDELKKDDFLYVVPDFRLNKVQQLENLLQKDKDKVEFLCNECCFIGCLERKKCYETVSRQNLEKIV